MLKPLLAGALILGSALAVSAPADAAGFRAHKPHVASHFRKKAKAKVIKRHRYRFIKRHRRAKPWWFIRRWYR